MSHSPARVPGGTDRDLRRAEECASICRLNYLQVHETMPKARLPTSEPTRRAAADWLHSWKEIAKYLNRDIRTLHRWEAQEGLPVHRHMHKRRGTVHAYRSELDTWRSRRVSHKRDSPVRRRMLAVLPFANLAGNSEQEYFSDGLTEEMLAQVGRLDPERLGVIARTSVMRYKGTSKGIDRIGRELGVDYVLEGSVRRAGGRVRITAQLIQVSDQSHLWAECYERDEDDILLVQSEIARGIAKEIHLAVTPKETVRLAQPKRVNSEAYEAYLKGRFHWYKLSRAHLDVAFDYFQLALEKDPNYALAHAGIAYVWLSRGDCGVEPPRQALPKAKAAIMKGLELDDTEAEVHEILAGVVLHSDWDWVTAEREYQRAIALDLNRADGHFMYADFLVSIGRPREALAEMARALELDPLNFLIRCFHGWHLVYMRRYDEAIVQLRETLRTEPDYPAVHLGLWGAFYQKRMYDDAIAEARMFFDLLGDHQLAETLRCGYPEAGYTATMHAAAETLAKRSEQTHVPAVRIARLYAHAGDVDRALGWLEEAYEAREAPLVHLRVAWDWDNLRAQPRFRDLVRRMNFPAARGA
jgi:TolB-like protein/Tfp pilus assembly protein PilF